MQPTDQQDLNARSDAGSFAAAGSLATLEQEVHRRRKHRSKLSRQRLLFTGLAGVFILLVLTGVGFSTYKFFKSRWFRQPADLFAVQAINFSANDLATSLVTIPLQSQNQPSQLGLNGDLRVGGNLSLSQQGITNLGEVLTNKLDLQSNIPALAQSGNVSITGTVGAAAFVGGGTQLTELSAANIGSGTLATARLNPDVSLLGQSISVTQIQPNIISSVNGLFGDGGNIALVGDGSISVTNTATGLELNQVGIGSGITQITLGTGLIGGGSSSPAVIDFDSSLATLQGNTFNGASQLLQLNGSAELIALDGSLLTSLSAAALTSGTVNDARLSTNVILKDVATNVLIPSADSTSAFAVRNAAGSQDVLRGDSTNGRVGIGYPTATAPSYTLDIYGDINVEPPSSTLLIGGVQICGTITCAIQEGSASYVQNTPTLQPSANIAIQSAGFSSIAGRIRGVAGQTANLLQIEEEGGDSIFEVSNNGSLLLQGEYLAQPPAMTRAFAVVYHAAPNIGVLRLDTDTERVGLLLDDAQMPQYRLDLGAGLGGDMNLATGSVMRIGGVAVCSSLGCSGDGSSIDYIRNSTTLQTGANFFVQSTAAGGLGAVRIAGAVGQTNDIFLAEDSSGDRVLSVADTGDLELKPVSNDYYTFQVIDSAFLARFAVDTFSGGVGISDADAYNFGDSLFVNVFGDDDGLVVNQSGSGDLLQLANSTGNVMQVSATGDTLFRTTTNASNAFAVITNSAAVVLNADTSQGSINVGGSSYTSKLGLTTGSQVGYTLDNYSTGNSLIVQKTGTTVLNVADTGNLTIQPAANTLEAVQVKSSAGAEVLQVATGTGSTNNTPSFVFNGGANGEVGSWSTNSTAMNKPLRDAGYVFMNGYMYRIGGTQQASRSTFTLESEVARAQVRADGSVGSWTAIGTLNDSVSWSLRSGFGMTAINGAIYTVGGYRFSNNITNGMHNSASFAKVQADGSLSSWTQVTSMDGCCTGQRGEGPLVNDGYGNMYYPGGISNYSAGSPLSGVYRETVRGNLWPSNGSWPHNSGISAMPAGRAGHRAEIANGYLYAIGGYAGASGSSVQSTVYYAKLNGSGGAGAWSTANAMPVSLKYHCSGVANGYMYVWGGDTGSGASNAIYYAKLNNDGSLGSWQTSSQTMPTGIASAGCAIINGRLYSFGGVTSAGSTTSAVYYAEIAKVRIYADLDLISLDSDSLAGSGNETGSSLMNGSNQKGSLFAGSIYAAGDLQATGSAQLTGGLTILDRFSTSGDALIKVNVNYSDRSVVVDNSAGSRVLTIDSFTSGETVGVNIGDTFGAIDAKMAVNGVTVGQNLMQVTDTSNGTLQALTIADGGATSFTNDCSTAAQCDETTAFQIQNASGTPLFNVDTLNARLTLGSTSANFDIDFEQNSSNRSAIVRDFVCTASEAAFDIVEFSAVDSAVRTTTANSNRVAGVVVAIPSLNTCTVAIGGVVQVNFGANPSPATIGDPVVTSATAGAAQSTTTPAVGAVLGNSISSKDGSNRVWVRLRRD